MKSIITAVTLILTILVGFVPTPVSANGVNEFGDYVGFKRSVVVPNSGGKTPDVSILGDVRLSYNNFLAPGYAKGSVNHVALSTDLDILVDKLSFVGLTPALKIGYDYSAYRCGYVSNGTVNVSESDGRNCVSYGLGFFLNREQILANVSVGAQTLFKQKSYLMSNPKTKEHQFFWDVGLIAQVVDDRLDLGIEFRGIPEVMTLDPSAKIKFENSLFFRGAVPLTLYEVDGDRALLIEPTIGFGWSAIEIYTSWRINHGGWSAGVRLNFLAGFSAE